MRYVGVGRLGAVQNVAYSGTAGTIANGISANVYMVRVVCTTDAWVTIDNSPTATATTSTFMAGGGAEYFSVTPGQKVSAIQSTAAGTLNVTEAS